MGFFSWKTADTGESIANRYAVEDCHLDVELRTAYLLQPDGRPAIEETRYEGYGVFGGVDAYVWLARENLSTAQLAGLDEERVRGLGITLALGEWLLDLDTGRAWAIMTKDVERIMPGVANIDARWDEVDPEFGMTPNEAMESGRFEKRDFRRFMKKPLKFSFDPAASYAALKASETCPFQGFFFDPPEDHEPEDEDEAIDDEGDLPLAA